MDLFYPLMGDNLGLPLLLADLLSGKVTVTHKEVRDAPSHNHGTVTLADSGLSLQVHASQ